MISGTNLGTNTGVHPFSDVGTLLNDAETRKKEKTHAKAKRPKTEKETCKKQMTELPQTKTDAQQKLLQHKTKNKQKTNMYFCIYVYLQNINWKEKHEKTKCNNNMQNMQDKNAVHCFLYSCSLCSFVCRFLYSLICTFFRVQV